MREQETEREENEVQYLSLSGETGDTPSAERDGSAENASAASPEEAEEALSLQWMSSGESSGDTIEKPKEKPVEEPVLESAARRHEEQSEHLTEKRVEQTIDASAEEEPETAADMPIETPVARPSEQPAEEAETPAHEEPDVELLARQLREEMRQKKTAGKTAAADSAKAIDELAEIYADDIKAMPGDEEETEEDPEDAQTRRIRGLFEYVETFCVALAVMIVLFLFVFRYVSVDGDSMLPTLHGGDSSDHADRLIISDFLYEPKTGDIVVINTGTSSQPLIKRVIAAAGQQVQINFNTWEVTVDGVRLQEDYITYIAGAAMRQADMAVMYGVDENGVCSFTVGEGKVFVMGDNRNNSKDSRFSEIGEQEVEHILGKVILRLYPLGEFGSV